MLVKRLLPFALSLFLCLISTFSFCQDKVCGFTFVGVPSKPNNNPVQELIQHHANYIAIVPYGFFRKAEANITFNHPRQWWGEKKDGVEQSVIWAKELGVHTMLKPQLWTHNTWIGEQSFDTETNWEKWEDSYREFILFYANIAQEMCIDILCIGTELKAHVEQRPEFFNTLIQEIRNIYTGKLTYSANWDNYDAIPFWKDLDYIGISAYFPLSNKQTPDLLTLSKAWKPYVNKMANFSKKISKPILFTEFGYLSVDGAASKTWELEANINHLNVNEKAQDIAFNALFECFYTLDWWAGGFIWKWFPNGKGGEGYNEKDYSPQSKLSLRTIEKYYELMND